VSASLALFFSTAIPAYAAEMADTPARPEFLNGEMIGQLLFGLFVVVAVILVLAWLLRRVGGVTVNNSQMKVVAGLALGHKERVLLVQVGESRQVLLGVTASQINTLAEFEEPVITQGAEQGEFAQRLRSVMQGKSKV